jgi:hypothetical protein
MGSTVLEIWIKANAVLLAAAALRQNWLQGNTVQNGEIRRC